MNNRTSVPASEKHQEGSERSTTSLIEEWFQHHDIADGLRLLRDIAHAAPYPMLEQTETDICQHPTLTNNGPDPNMRGLL